MLQVIVQNFDDWRGAARKLYCAKIHPAEVTWLMNDQLGLFGEQDDLDQLPAKRAALAISEQALTLLQDAACFNDDERWALMYRFLWRYGIEGASLLRMSADSDVATLMRMQKAIHRDCHKMKAFVRFKKVPAEGLGEVYCAFFKPEHFIVERMAGFFKKRFYNMHWQIFTPKGSMSWLNKTLTFSEPVARDNTNDDALEALWLTYYKSIFNPARIKIKAMQSEMPKKYWRGLPEAPLIKQLLSEAGGKVQSMYTASPTAESESRAKALKAAQQRLREAAALDRGQSQPLD